MRHIISPFSADAGAPATHISGIIPPDEYLITALTQAQQRPEGNADPATNDTEGNNERTELSHDPMCTHCVVDHSAGGGVVALLVSKYPLGHGSRIAQENDNEAINSGGRPQRNHNNREQRRRSGDGDNR